MQSAWLVRISLFTFALLLGGCASVNVQTDHDPSVDFSQFRTYAWKRLPDSSNPLFNNRIVAAVDAQLFARGWRKVTEQQAQTVLAASTATERRQRIHTYHNNWGPGWHGWGWGGPVMTTSRVETYTVGTLVVDLYDVRTKNAIWRGSASGIVSSNPDRFQRSLNEGVQKMFAQFPPGVAKP